MPRFLKSYIITYKSACFCYYAYSVIFNTIHFDFKKLESITDFCNAVIHGSSNAERYFLNKIEVNLLIPIK